jgi:hypothetical protein
MTNSVTEKQSSVLLSGRASFWLLAASKVQKLIKLGLLGWVGEVLRRFIS